MNEHHAITTQPSARRAAAGSEDHGARDDARDVARDDARQDARPQQADDAADRPGRTFQRRIDCSPSGASNASGFGAGTRHR